MDTQQIREIQGRIGTTVDGHWGPKSEAACRSYLRSLMPSPHPWPAADQRSLRAFYGQPGDESRLVKLLVPAGVTVRYFDKELGKPGPMDDYILCHAKVQDSLARVLVALSKLPEGAAVLRQYAGMYNNRSVRGGSTPSLHAYAAAIDLDPAPNGNNVHWPTGATMPLSVMECFAREGWLSAGAFWSRDAMHFQATR